MVDLDSETKAILHQRLDDVGPSPDFLSHVLRRGAKRRRAILAAGFATTLALAGGAAAVLAEFPLRGTQSDSDAVPAAPSPATSAPAPGTCGYGPWADHCPEARWARRVLEVAGFPPTGDTGSAIEARTATSTIRFWGFDTATEERDIPFDVMVEQENYERHSTVDGVEVYSDGYRLTWEIHGLYVWLRAWQEARGTVDLLTPDEVRDIVRASAEVPYSSGRPMADCPHVEARPTYLPWLDKGEEVPEPQLEVENGTSYVMWASGDGDPSQKSVIFRRNSEPRGGLGEAVSVRLEGARGYYYASPGSSAAVLWKTDSETCDLITLAVSLPGSDQAEIRDEVLRIVESLQD